MYVCMMLKITYTMIFVINDVKFQNVRATLQVENVHLCLTQENDFISTSLRNKLFTILQKCNIPFFMHDIKGLKTRL